ncbi:hypothetical protein ST47_g7532 [Ascochyta rabiei]|uniref:Uncharacterized protein n=1 Tax=Didymella rabiei TaxID=5454 RepID=A0A163AQJ6_DIDRA|nr:hypothetical protein ST47_g7532 [Ascochyta rabiei]
MEILHTVVPGLEHKAGLIFNSTMVTWLGAVCSALEVGKEYCVEWSGTPPALPKSPKTSSTPTPTPTPAPTTLSTVTSTKITTIAPVATCASTPAGVVTPSPIQLCTFDLKKGEYVCPTAPPTATPTSVKNPAPGPTQEGINAKCNKWVLQKTGVYCFDMAKAASVALDRLYTLNPALKGDCSGLWPGYAYCIGTL